MSKPVLAPPERSLSAADYFRAFETVKPPSLPAMTTRQTILWQVFAVFAAALGAWYLHWRWIDSLNPDALTFSIIVAVAETAMYLGTLLFYFDIWEEGDTPSSRPTNSGREAGLDHDERPSVDIFIATYDEDPLILSATLQDAKRVKVPAGWDAEIYLLDDGDRPEVAALAHQMDVRYLARSDNRGFKAGNLRNALFQTDGDFIVICDADTRLFPSFLENTLGYFRDSRVAWVQTPHWFYDIPTGREWPRQLKRIASWLTGMDRQGSDPFLCRSLLFFDVIQRRRNRHGASFCCGAGSIHRREPLFEDALTQHSRDRAGRGDRALAARLTPLQPFRFHVSEDIYTSMLLHRSKPRRWRSVYHPQIESKMLSPWSMEAWAGQKLKYAGGTVDLMRREAPRLLGAMPWQIMLHYAATFWSYLSGFLVLTLILAPIVSLVTGAAPVAAYSLAFFLHLLPVLLANEVALAVGAKGQDAHQGRVLSVATLPITLYAFWLVGLGKRIRFQPTPKTPMFSGALRHVWPHLALLAAMMVALLIGVGRHLAGSEDHSMPLLIVNGFWLAWCAVPLMQVVAAAFWKPKPRKENEFPQNLSLKTELPNA